MQDPHTILFGIILAAFILGWFYFRKPPAPTTQRADLRLEGEFHPSELKVRSGIPLHLHIHRLDSEPEDEWVLIPELKVEEPLPPMMTTVLHLEPLSAGKFLLTCRMGKAQSLLIAEEHSP
jgi:plastocyanin domain-containing protein